MMGLGRACHREFEAFAVGTPVIMPTFDNKFYTDLIPDHHYIAVPRNPGDVQRKPQRVAKAIRERYEEVKDNQDFLNLIRNNAMGYYDKYLEYRESAEWFMRLLEL